MTINGSSRTRSKNKKGKGNTSSGTRRIPAKAIRLAVDVLAEHLKATECVVHATRDTLIRHLAGMFRTVRGIGRDFREKIITLRLALVQMRKADEVAWAETIDGQALLLQGPKPRQLQPRKEPSNMHAKRRTRSFVNNPGRPRTVVMSAA
ncbi:MAG: hypothetical protein JWN33_218 [Candidatus Saccharibacteria bacterium]|nr:hypothetical protein [Candidatus Saccharibacteria bacterium]